MNMEKPSRGSNEIYALLGLTITLILLSALAVKTYMRRSEPAFITLFITGYDGKVESIPVVCNPYETIKLNVNLLNKLGCKSNFKVTVYYLGKTIFNDTITVENDETGVIPLTFNSSSPGLNSLVVEAEEVHGKAHATLEFKIQVKG